jgi:hypothetical protein
MAAASSLAVPPEFVQALASSVLPSQVLTGAPLLTGGVPSDIWRIDTEPGPVGAKPENSTMGGGKNVLPRAPWSGPSACVSCRAFDPKINRWHRRSGIGEPQAGRRRRSPGWTNFVRNHARAVLACDFFVAVTVRFRLFNSFVRNGREHATHRALECDGAPHS